MLFMVVERFRDRDAKAVYRRLRDHGRMMPDGLKYVGSWIEANFDRCFQLMECDDAALLQEWLLSWGDLMHMRDRAGGAVGPDPRARDLAFVKA